jgi:ABC-type amino acid transport substrate-binding protein
MGILKLVFAAAVGSVVAATAQAQQIRVLAANPQGSIFYAGSVAIGKLMDDKLKMQVRVQPMAGSSTYIPLLDRGETDFGLTNVDDAVSAYKGIGSFRQANPNIRLIAAVFQLNFGILVPNDSPIKTIKDLKGKTMPWGYNAQVTGRILQSAALASEGLTMDDVKQVPTQSLFSGVDMLGEGKVEAAALAIGTAQVQRANVSLASHGGPLSTCVDTRCGCKNPQVPAGAAGGGPARAACGGHRCADDSDRVQRVLQHAQGHARRSRLHHRQGHPWRQGRHDEGPSGVQELQAQSHERGNRRAVASGRDQILQGNQPMAA